MARRHKRLEREHARLAKVIGIDCGEELNTGELIARSTLLNTIDRHFDVDELGELLFMLGFPSYRGFPGETKREKIIELIKEMECSNYMDRLARMLADIRPHLPWQDIIDGYAEA